MHVILHMPYEDNVPYEPSMKHVIMGAVKCEAHTPLYIDKLNMVSVFAMVLKVCVTISL